VQTTLLGLAIALILALVSALVAPLVVDWNHYRVAVETEASRLTGLSVHVNGTIDARLLPSPVITLHDVDVGGAGQEPQLRAGSLELELSLSPLLRGQVQASNVHLIRPQISLGLDGSGAIEWPAQSPSFRPDALSVLHVNVEDGSVNLTDAASGSRLLLQKVWFNGDMSSFAGAFSGEGAAVVDDELYGYRISASRVEGAAGIKIRIGIDPSNHPLTTDFDGILTFDRGVPQFDGTMALARPVGATLANGQRVLSAPWHAASTLRATPASAAIEHAVLRYGPEERALDFSGRAKVTFGAHPHLDADVAALQLDVDRALAAPDVTGRPPFVVLRNFLQAFAAGAKPPIPAQIGVSIDALTVAGTTIESLNGALHSDQAGWSVSNLKFRAPGTTDVTLSGKLTGTPQGFAFNGPAALQSGDVDMLMSWLNGRSGNGPSGAAKTISARGDVTIASDRMALEQLKATLDQENIEGRLAYNWPMADRPARLDAELRAAALDLDALTTFAKAMVGDNGFALPQEATLALDIGTATFAGVRAQAVNAQIKFDAGKLQIDRLSVGDLGGAALAVSGRIDELSSQPRGQLTLDLNARALEGISDILAKFTPLTADSLRRAADRLAPAKVHAVLTVEHAQAAASSAELQLNGSLATMRAIVDGKATGQPAHLGDVAVQIDSRIDADDGSALVALFGLDRLLAVDQLPGQLTLAAAGPLNGDVHVDGKMAVSGFAGAIAGVLRFNGNRMPMGTLQVMASAGDLRPLQQAMTGQPGVAVPVSVRAALAVDGADLSFTDIAATVGKAAVKGHLAVNLATTIGLDGDIEADQADAASVMALLLGLPSGAQGAAAPWSTAPIGNGAFSAMKGAVAFKLGQAALTPALVVRGLTGVAHFRSSEIGLDDIGGSLAGGHLTGALAFRRDPTGLAAHGQVELAGATAATILGPAMNVAGGTLSTALQSDGFGSSPSGLIGSLHGNGTVTLKDAQFAGLDAAAFGAAIQAAGLSGSIDMAKVQSAINAALANGHVAVPQADVAITITSGAINLTKVTLQAQDGSQLALDGIVDLGNAAIDTRMRLSEPPPAGAMIGTRPELSVSLKGPLGSPQRTLDISALTSWLTLNAAELQTRRIESIEANQRLGAADSAGHEGLPDIRVPPPGTVVELAAPPNLMSAPIPGQGALERLQPVAPPIVPNQIPPASGSVDPGPDAAVVPAPVPAPKAIRPGEPRTLLRTDRNTATATPPDQPKRQAAPQPPRVTSESTWLDFLFRPHN
jgi:uncharacterized protein involved in outer membrane biogenesis